MSDHPGDEWRSGRSGWETRRTAPAEAAVRRLRPVNDPNVAAIFRTMRAVVGGSEMDVARRIGTDVAVIMDLEAGAVHDLPPWSTTSRVVERYGSMAGVDVTAVLAAMARLMRPAEPLEMILPAMPSERQAPVTAALRTRPPGQSRSEPLSPVQAAPRARLSEPEVSQPPPSGWRPLAKRVGIMTGIIVLLFGLVLMAPRPLYATARWLPAPLDRPVRAVANILVSTMAPTRDGLRWIEIRDPRARKADRLDLSGPPKR